MIDLLYTVVTFFLLAGLGAVTAIAIWDCVGKNENAE